MRFLITLSLCFVTVSAQSCTVSDALNCLQPQLGNDQQPYRGLMLKADIQEQCRIAKSAASCFDGYLKRCKDMDVPAAQNEHKSLQRFVNDFCDDGASLKAYEPHVGCLEPLKNEIMTCVKNKGGPVGGTTPEQTRERYCSQIKVGFECSQSIIKSKCNEEAAKMAEKVALAFMPEQQKELCGFGSAIRGVQPQVISVVLALACALFLCKNLSQ